MSERDFGAYASLIEETYKIPKKHREFTEAFSSNILELTAGFSSISKVIDEHGDALDKENSSLYEYAKAIGAVG
jgi:hypothetical protein